MCGKKRKKEEEIYSQQLKRYWYLLRRLKFHLKKKKKKKKTLQKIPISPPFVVVGLFNFFFFFFERPKIFLNRPWKKIYFKWLFLFGALLFWCQSKKKIKLLLLLLLLLLLFKHQTEVCSLLLTKRLIDTLALALPFPSRFWFHFYFLKWFLMKP